MEYEPHYIIKNIYMYIIIYTHCKNKIVKITNLLVSTVARNNGDCNLIGHVGCYEYKIVISKISLIDVQIRLNIFISGFQTFFVHLI